MRLVVGEAAFDPGSEANRFAGATGGAGAIVTFTGLVRGGAGSAGGMVIEHYPGMTEKAISAIMDQARLRWNLIDVLVIHRYGKLAVGEPIMMVGTAAIHRSEAFHAADFLMDYLKSRAPFWKKEMGADGEEWVASKDADEAALKRW
jgi:molybdopterin synthase catalytic subunit